LTKFALLTWRWHQATPTQTVNVMTWHIVSFVNGRWMLPKNVGVAFLYGTYSPEKDFELILTVKMETGHPIEGQFGSEFLAICNHCGVMMVWSRKTRKFCEQFLHFILEKRPLMVTVWKFCSKVYMATPIDIVFKFCEIRLMGNRWNRALLTWPKTNISSLSNCHYCSNRAQNLPGPAPNNVLTVLHISSKSVHFRLSYSRTHEDHFCP